LRTVEFRRLFDNQNAARVLFDLERDQVIRFVVQLECQFDGEWVPVVRYDTHHGFAHRDLLHPFAAPTKREMAVRDYNEGLTFAIRDLRENWERYRRRHAEWLKK